MLQLAALYAACHWQISTLANGHIIKKYYETAIFPSKIIHGHEKVNNK